jgi:hypothetical protein
LSLYRVLPAWILLYKFLTFLSLYAGSYNSSTGEFLPQENDFYFLPDPRDLIYTHFPHNPAEKDYR